MTLGRRVHLGIGSIVSAPHKLTIEDGVYIGKFCTVECDGAIGKNVLIANGVGLIGRYDHDHRQLGMPMRLASWIGDPGYIGAGRGLQVVVEDDVWIGFGAIVAAGSVVVGDVDRYAIVAGNPARTVGWRFTAQEIIAHERTVSTK